MWGMYSLAIVKAGGYCLCTVRINGFAGFPSLCPMDVQRSFNARLTINRTINAKL